MPTYDRPEFVSRAVDYFLLQDYAPCELIVLDDGTQPVEHLIPSDPRVRYVRMQGRASTGSKRNLGCQLADGELILNWDDDDWYGRHRISHQLAPLLAGTADASAMVRSLILELDPLVFWTRDDLPAGELTISPETVSAGTMAYSKRLWSACGGYEDQGRFEDSGFMMRMVEKGARIQAAQNPGVFAYIRHRHNSFARIDMDYQPEGWRPIPPPDFFPAADLAFYAGVSRLRATT
jgi:glycosyltransferase involved in cell wall biosynthesis